MGDGNVLGLGEALRQALRQRIGAPRILKPQVTGEIGVELGRHEPHLGQQMARFLAPVFEIANVSRIEEDHRLRGQRAVLGGPERQRVHAALPRRLGRCAAQRHQGVGEAGAVDMQLQAFLARQLRDRPQLVRRVDRAELGGLGEADGAGLRMMHEALLEMFERGGDRRGLELGVGAFQRHELGAMGEELRRAALVDRDMGFGMADDGAVLWHQRRQRQRVGARAVDDRIDRDLALEDRAKPLGDAGGVP